MRSFLLFVFMSSMTAVCFSVPSTKATLQITDADVGNPVSNAVVTAAFMVKDNWDKADEYEKIKVSSDSLGGAVLSGNDVDNYFYAKVNYENYYESIAKIESKTLNRILNRWEPWNPTIEVKMRPIKNPVSMVFRTVSIKKIPEMNKPIGFDLEISDWVAPHGKGVVSDFIFNASWFFQDPQRGSDAQYTLSFSNEPDGIQTYLFPKEISSSFKWPYEAPLNSYQPTLQKHIFWPANGGERETDYDDINNYIFRVRSKKLNDGSIVGSYGMIQRDIEVGPRGSLKFEYWFNPDPTNRSLEYNGVNLLEN